MENSVKENVVLEKSKKFAIRIIRLCRYLKEVKSERVLSNQILKSGTSIGANLAEASQAQSKADFLSKINISLKECTETKYWIESLYGAQVINDMEYKSIYEDCVELEKLLTSITRTTKNNINVRL